MTEHPGLDTFINQLASNQFQEQLRFYPTFAEIIVREDGNVEKTGLYAFCNSQTPREPPFTDMSSEQPQVR